MQEDKHGSALKEVNTYIGESLKSGSLLQRQRLLMTALSLGMQHVVELWLHKARAIKPDASIKYEYFKSEEKRLKLKLAGMLTKNISSLKNADAIISIAREIERSKDDIIYGAPLQSDGVLREKIDYFFELKKAVKEAVGDVE